MNDVDAWEMYESLRDRDRAGLTELERNVAAICDFQQEVNSGGFDRYFRYSGGDSAPDALAALPHVFGFDMADLLREAMQLLGSDYPTDQAEREERLDAADVDDELDALDHRYYELEAEIDVDALNDYVRNAGGWPST